LAALAASAVRVLTVVGCRPQFVKAAPVSRALEAAGVEEVLVHTGQHYDSGLDLCAELGVVPDLNLGQTTLGGMADTLREHIRFASPDWVLVYGDTRSTLAGALASGPVPVAHVEAGCRSGDWSMPEEHNRVLVDRLSSLLLCSSDEEADNLRNPWPDEIVVTGDVMADAVRLFGPGKQQSRADHVMLTIHREANIPRLPEIVAAMAEVDADVFFAAHPRARKALDGVALPPNVMLRDPLGYRESLWLAAVSRCVVTDSGGLQKEAYWLGTPCVTVRPSTEWTATVDAGANTLVDPEGIPAAVAAARFPASAPQLYGDGFAAERIVEALLA
jgi:UDP-N-acetylglucosamine 2-epimerase